jgi:hypothetical protein
MENIALLLFAVSKGFSCDFSTETLLKIHTFLREYYYVFPIVAIVPLSLLWVMAGNLLRKVVIVTVVVLAGVLFGDYVTIEAIKSALPKIVEFLKGFGIRILVIMIMIACALQIAHLISVFFKSCVWRFFLKYFQVTLRIIAGMHPMTAKVVSGLTWLADCIKVALVHFYDIERDDEAEDVVGKVRELHLMSLLYDIIDYWAAGLCALLVSYLVEYQFSYAQKSVIVWAVIDVPFALSALYGCFKTGKDLTWGEAHRRAHDGVYAYNRIAGWIYRIVQHAVGTLWDGPEQIAAFYAKELRTKTKMVIFVLALSVPQAIFWAWAYTLGNDAIIVRFLEWLG